MFKQQEAEIKSQSAETDKKFKQAVVENKIMEQRLRQENNEY